MSCDLYAEEGAIPDPIQREAWESKYGWTPILEEPAPELRKSQWEIVPEAFWFYYSEPPVSIKTEGMMAGIRTTFTKRGEGNSMMGRLEGRYSAGDTEYDGSLSDGTPFKETDENYIFELRGALGYDWAVWNTVITPYLGLGYRYWFNDGESAHAYERNIRYLYSPIGVEWMSLQEAGWSWGIRAEYDLFWRGWVKSHLSNVNPAYNDLDNTQNTGFGLRGSIFLRQIVNEKVSISIEPFIRYWDIDDSDTAPWTYLGTLIGGGYEPANKTAETGLQVSIIF